MQTLIETLRQVVGAPTFDGANEMEYFFCCLIVVIVITSVFKIIVKVFER